LGQLITHQELLLQACTAKYAKLSQEMDAFDKEFPENESGEQLTSPNSSSGEFASRRMQDENSIVWQTTEM
jgi:hypothetical protein